MFTFTPLRSLRVAVVASLMGCGLLTMPFNTHHAGAWTIGGCSGCVSTYVAVRLVSNN